jgi:hypothetical protein
MGKSCRITHVNIYKYEAIDGPAVVALRRAITEVKQRWSVIWMGNQDFITSSSAVLRKVR